MSDFFETKDANKASALLASRIPYRGNYTAPEGHVVFRFLPDDRGRINDILTDYDFDLPMPARSLLEARHFINRQIAQAKRNRQEAIPNGSGGVQQ